MDVAEKIKKKVEEFRQLARAEPPAAAEKPVEDNIGSESEDLDDLDGSGEDIPIKVIHLTLD